MRSYDYQGRRREKRQEVQYNATQMVKKLIRSVKNFRCILSFIAYIDHDDKTSVTTIRKSVSKKCVLMSLKNVCVKCMYVCMCSHGPNFHTSNFQTYPVPSGEALFHFVDYTKIFIHNSSCGS